MKKLILLFGLCVWGNVFSLFSQNAVGRVVEDSVYSRVLDTYRKYSVYLPPDYDRSAVNYPVLYLLHGLGNTHMIWPERGHIRSVMDLLVPAGKVCNMIIVSPEAGGDIHTEWNGYFDMPGWQYETFFFTEFLPYIEARYRIMGDKTHRAIAGLSMGGGGAVSYAQRHSDMFCAAYAMSALVAIPERGMIESARPDDKIAVLTRAVIERDCIRYVREAGKERIDSLRSVTWFVDCGDDDFLLDRNIEFYQVMRNAGIPCQFRVRDGEHVWEYWHSALYICLPYVSRVFTSAERTKTLR